ncbi:mucin TcMUC [Trypanosoma cruzi]|nr:mucin TcMUC [Trypanosoma cruzi]
MQTSANIQTETQMVACFIPFLAPIFFWLCCCYCCGGGRACMKWCASDMNEGQTQDNKLLCDEYWLHFPWTNNPRGVRGSHFSWLLCFCVAVCAAPPLVCVRTLREGCGHDGPLSPHVHALEPCVPLLFASPSSICVLVLRQGCVCLCVPVAVDWSVCRAWCAAYGACLAAALSSCGLPSVCVCLPHLSSPLLLSISLTVQISSTPLNDHTHDDDVPSAVRPVGARPVLPPVRLRDSK